MTKLLVFLLFVVVASVIQVCLIPLPLGLAAILVWFILYGSKHIVWLVLMSSIFLAISASLPAWAILLATSVALALFISGKSFFPNRLATNVGLVAVSGIAWEISMVALLKLTSTL